MKSKLKLKVCGMRDENNISNVAALNPDFMGFIFYDGSKRYVGPHFSIPENLPNRIARVGVFVNESVETILKQVAKHHLDYVQLHGDESVDVCKKLKDKVKVIKVFRVEDSFDFDSTKKFDSCADFFLFDTKAKMYGGTGQSFNWNLLKRYNQDTPFFLSGGLSLENVKEVSELKHSRLYALDFNSRVESEPGLKDINTLNSIFSILNSY